MGGLLCFLALQSGGLVVVSQQDLDEQAQVIADLRKENQELTDDLFNFQGPETTVDPGDLPYDESTDARAMVADARRRAAEEGKFLMITFGANWCMDCRTLYRNLQSDEVMAYARDLFQFANVDVGNFDRNADVAKMLGVELTRGIPVAIFFDPDGNEIGTTNAGELDTARLYSSKQILRFVRNIAERSLIAAPDSIQ